MLNMYALFAGKMKIHSFSAWYLCFLFTNYYCNGQFKDILYAMCMKYSRQIHLHITIL